ncbi:hypothetical protein [Saccharothrix sp. HUAS TT1]|uniref:hypothetical protein n=1 Tax=unclassified Saccharothrix TaxID=2593673 RepID=UPI00345BDAC1
MIKTSSDGSLPQFAVRDRLRAHARSGAPGGHRVPPPPPPPPLPPAAGKRDAGPAQAVVGVAGVDGLGAAEPVEQGEVVVPLLLGPFRLTVDGRGRLVAEHLPTGGSRILFAPRGGSSRAGGR